MERDGELVPQLTEPIHIEDSAVIRGSLSDYNECEQSPEEAR